MLTADQIARAQFWVHAHADPEIAADLLARGAVDGALAVYGRMMALRQRWYDAKIKPSNDEMWRAFIGALEG
jgi:hypothetical protein